MGKIKKHKFTFGPVPSRRLGKSLGIDFIPFKTCTYDCIYCQLGRTTYKTTELKEYFPVKDVIQEVQQKLGEIPRPDYITLSGSGEPTLHSRIEDIIHGIKKITDIPVAVLTNGSLLWVKEVRDSVLEADLIIPSLDAGDKNTFSYVNRPHANISFSSMIDGLCSLRKKYKGSIWLEVFVVKNITDTEDQITKIKSLINIIAPDIVQLNTAIRTPAEDFVKVVSKEKMEQIKDLIGSTCEVIADYPDVINSAEFSSTQENVLDLLKRRPCSIDDISGGLNIHRNEAVKYVNDLLAENIIKMEKRGNKVLYFEYGNSKR